MERQTVGVGPMDCPTLPLIDLPCTTDSVVCIKIGKFDNRSNKDGFQAIKTDNCANDHVS